MPTFVKVRCDPRFKNLTQWCLRIDKDDYDAISDVLGGVVASASLRLDNDPHMKEPVTHEVRDVMAFFLNPYRLSEGWIKTANMMFSDYGYILVNSHGGLFPPSKDLVILATVRHPKGKVLVFPDTFTKRHPNERITISRWGENKHCYLSSSEGRLFVPEKFETLAEAKRFAGEIVSEKMITVKELTANELAKDGD